MANAFKKKLFIALVTLFSRICNHCNLVMTLTATVEIDKSNEIKITANDKTSITSLHTS